MAFKLATELIEGSQAGFYARASARFQVAEEERLAAIPIARSTRFFGSKEPLEVRSWRGGAREGARGATSRRGI